MGLRPLWSPGSQARGVSDSGRVSARLRHLLGPAGLSFGSIRWWVASAPENLCGSKLPRAAVCQSKPLPILTTGSLNRAGSPARTAYHSPIPTPTLRERRHRGLAHRRRVGPGRDLCEPSAAHVRCDRGGGNRETREMRVGELQHGGSKTTAVIPEMARRLAPQGGNFQRIAGTAARRNVNRGAISGSRCAGSSCRSRAIPTGMCRSAAWQMASLAPWPGTQYEPDARYPCGHEPPGPEASARAAAR
jgi:hypothetical protein